MKNTHRPFWQSLLIQVLGTALGVLLTLSGRNYLYNLLFLNNEGG